MRILVSGMLAGVPRHGGASWAVLQYVLGFARLGHDVFFVEPVEPTGIGENGKEAGRVRVAYFQDICRRFGLDGRASLLVGDSGTTIGASRSSLREFARSADLLVNLSGVLKTEELVARIPDRLYVDLDPGFTQLWAADGIDMGFDRHTRHATVGLAVANGSARVPGCDVDWIATLPPVVMEHWPVTAAPAGTSYTSVANWRGYGSVEYGGVHFGQKAHSFRALAALPRRTERPIEIALGIHPSETTDLSMLAANGWKLLEPDAVAGTPRLYEEFVGSSRGEMGLAKTGYVVGETGWFSDRSACYLASGRPVIAQETGFSSFLPTGEGLLSFSTVQQAVDALEAVEAQYDAHCRAAREIAEDHLDSDRVLTALLQNVENVQDVQEAQDAGGVRNAEDVRSKRALT